MTTPDPNWTPLWNTPPFPSYASGHSTFSGTASTILASIFGPNVQFSNGSDDMPGYSRTFNGFGDAANEAGESRVVGGIHFAFDNTDGLAAGREIGSYVTRNFLTPVEEHSHGSGNVIVASAQVKPASASLSSGALVLFYQQITSSSSSAGLIGDHVAPVAITRSVEPVASERIAPRNLDLNAPRISAQQRMGGIVLSITIDVDLIADQVDEILQI